MPTHADASVPARRGRAQTSQAPAPACPHLVPVPRPYQAPTGRGLSRGIDVAKAYHPTRKVLDVKGYLALSQVSPRALSASGSVWLVQLEAKQLLLPASPASTLLVLERVSLALCGGLREIGSLMAVRLLSLCLVLCGLW